MVALSGSSRANRREMRASDLVASRKHSEQTPPKIMCFFERLNSTTIVVPCSLPHPSRSGHLNGRHERKLSGKRHAVFSN
jgi:hypothetical protein